MINLDEVLSNSLHRKQFIEEGSRKDWDSYFELANKDTINPWCRALIYSVNSNNMTSILFSCRPSLYLQQTNKWLLGNRIYPYSYNLLVKPEKCSSFNFEEIKRVIYDSIKDQYKIIFAVDSKTETWNALDVGVLKYENNEEKGEKTNYELSK